MGKVRRDTMYASMQKMTKGKELLLMRLKWAYGGATCYVDKVKVMVAGEMKDSVILHPTGDALGANSDKDLGVKAEEEIPF